MNYDFFTEVLWRLSRVPFWQWAFVVVLLANVAVVYAFHRLNLYEADKTRRAIAKRLVDNMLAKYDEGPAVGTWAPEAKHPLDSRPYPRKPKRAKKAGKR
jgi:hypothetical protein